MEQRPRPYLTAAVLCERVLIEKDDSISAIRIADKLTLQLPPGGLPADAKPLVAITLLVAVKSKEPVGESEIIVNAIRPSGEAKQVASMPFNLLGNGQGQNYVLNLAIGVEELGLHWFEILFEDEILTMIPLTIELSKPEQATPPNTLLEQQH